MKYSTLQVSEASISPPLLTCNGNNDERLANALEAAKIMQLIPLWGIVPGPDGNLRCECGKECVRSAGKHPRPIMRWYDKGTREPAVIRRWFADWPHMNFAALTGNGVLGVSITSRDAKLWLEQSQSRYKAPIFRTLTSWSGPESQEWQIYFKNPRSDIPNKINARPGIHVLGRHGCVVVPGSRHIRGWQYKWQEGCGPSDVAALEDMPAWLLEELRLEQPNGDSSVVTPKASTSFRPASFGSNPQRQMADIQRLRETYGIDVSHFNIQLDAQPPEKKLDRLFNSRKQNHDKIMDTWDVRRGPGTRFPFHVDNDSSYQLSLAITGACNQWQPQEIVDLLAYWHRVKRPGSHVPEREALKSTLLTAFLFAEGKGWIPKKDERPRIEKRTLVAA